MCHSVSQSFKTAMLENQKLSCGPAGGAAPLSRCDRFSRSTQNLGESSGGTKPVLCCLKRLLSLWMCQSWHAGNRDGVWWSQGASVHYRVIVLHFRFGVCSYEPQVAARGSDCSLQDGEIVGDAVSGECWPLSCFIGTVCLGRRGGGQGCRGRPGRRETCGHHGLCAGMEATEPCPRSSSSTNQHFVINS